MKYIQKGLSNEINEKEILINNYLKENSIYLKETLKNLCFKSIEKDVITHSWMIENPNLIPQWCVSRNTKKKGIKKGVKNLENAFSWGIKNFDFNTFNQSFLKKLSGMTNPELYQNKDPDFRENGTSILGASTTPPYPEKLVNYEIPWFIHSLKEQSRCPFLINKIETAIFAHLHLVRIHPFVDGNGRVSRILEDIILYKENIPSPLITPSERYLYYELLDKAILDWDEKKALRKKGASEGEFLFYNFIASKINSSYDKLLYKIFSKNKK
jgi:Fic family protein